MPRPESTARVINLDGLSPDAYAALLIRTEGDLSAYLEPVQAIIDAVRDQGDEALADCARRFDKAPSVTADTLKATPADFDAAFEAVEPDVIESIRFAIDNVRRFHQAQMPEEMWLKEMSPGVFAGDRVRPIPSVACYVPRGKGSFPSVVMMTTVPAVVAGVPRVVVLTPPGPDGKVDAATLVAARLAGVEDVFKCGGAQGVAAVAYGTETVPRCVKVVGPGSPWVLAGKKLLAGRIDPGIPAGPSESLILADSTADGALAALDLLVEAEHGPDSSAYLVTDSQAVADAAIAALPGYWAQMGDERAGFSQTVLSGPRGGIIVAPDFDAAVAFTNDYAPEHLMIHSREPFAHLGRIENAGEILLGDATPIPLGNFVLGPNAVLPTGRNARTWSALSVFDYLKRTSVGYVTRDGYKALAPHAHRLAVYEGFDAHANAVSPLRDEIMKRNG